MALAYMIKLDRNALLCDLAETYNIYSFEQLPISKLAIFSCGLRDNSRIKMKISNMKVDSQTLLLASILDANNTQIWMNTQDGVKGVNRPKSMTQTLLGEIDTNNASNVMSFKDANEFETVRNKIIEGSK